MSRRLFFVPRLGFIFDNIKPFQQYYNSNTELFFLPNHYRHTMNQNPSLSKALALVFRLREMPRSTQLPTKVKVNTKAPPISAGGRAVISIAIQRKSLNGKATKRPIVRRRQKRFRSASQLQRSRRSCLIRPLQRLTANQEIVRDLFPCYEVTLIPDRYTNHPWRRPQRGMTWQATLSILVKFTGKSQNAIKPYPYTT
jgi:hypothetical protein